MKYFSTLFVLLFWANCTYDSTPPGDDKIHDSKPLLMLDITLTTASAQRRLQLQYTDTLGQTTVATSAEQTDASGRFLYPLYMKRGTRFYTIDSIVIDQSGDGSFGAGDLNLTGIPRSGTFATDSDIQKLSLTAADF